MFMPVNMVEDEKNIVLRCGDICMFCDEPDDDCTTCDGFFDMH